MSRGFAYITTFLAALLLACSLGAQPFLDLKSVEPLSKEVNSEAEEGYPLYAPDGRLYFVRSLYKGNRGGQSAGQDIWYIERTSNGWTTPSNDLGKLNNKFNNGVVGVADSGNVLYLNSTYSNKADYQIGLSKSRRKEKGWTPPQRIRMRGFDPRSRYFTFYVDDKNQVMLMSYAENDVSSEDIYISLKKGDAWSSPIPLTSINTEYSEFAPFLSEDGTVLYFSSNGYPGQGDFDIYMSRKIGGSWTNWSEPVSLPAPINSPKFDAYFTIRGTEAFFSSNRNGDFADLFHATYEKREREIDEEEMKKEQLFAEGLLEGFVEPVEGAKLKEVDVLDTAGDVVMTMQPDSAGRFEMIGLADYSKFFIDLKGRGLEGSDVYILNKRGDRVYLNQELISGKYPFETLEKDIQAVLVAEVSDESSFQGSTFQLTALKKVQGTVMQLTSPEGELIEEQKADKQGFFEFKRLQTGEYYSLSADPTSDDGRLFIEREGDMLPLSSNILKGLLFKRAQNGDIVLYQDELLASFDAAKFRFDYETLDAGGTSVFLYDEDGTLLEQAIINEDGLFAFSPLDPDKSYRLGMSEELDLSKGTLFGYNEQGDEVPLAEAIALGEFFQGNPAWAIIAGVTEVGEESFRFDYGDLPPEGSIVYLTDEDDNIIDSAMVDENGEFSFLRLKPDQAYKIKLKDAADMSMGLDRFFIVDAEGEKVGFNADGTTTRNIVGEELAATTEKFSFEEENAPPPGTVVYLTDEENNVVDSAVVDENGEFRFLRLKPDEAYKIKLADTDDMSMGLSRFFVFDADGEKVGFNEDGSTSKNIVGKELAATTEKFTFEEESAPPPGTVVYLTDEENNVVDSAVVDENGEFRFLRLKPDEAYKIKLASTDDMSMGLDRFFLIDAEGEKVAFNADGESETLLVGQALAKTTDKFPFAEEQSAPPGTVVYLTDDFGNVIDSAIADENGVLRYGRLDDRDRYKLKVTDTKDVSDGLGSLAVVDAEGDLVNFNKEGLTEGSLVGKDAAANTEGFKFDEENKPEAGTVVYLTDENDNVVDSAVVDENGEFRFLRLKPDQAYKIKLQDAQDMSAGLAAFFIYDAAGNKVEMGEDGVTKTRVMGKDEAKLVRYYAFDYDELIPDGTIIYITDENDNIVDSVIVNNGGFVYRRLDAEGGDGLQMRYADGSMNLGDGFNLIEGREGEERRNLKLANSIDRKKYFDSFTNDQMFDRFSQFKFEGDAPLVGTKVYIYNKTGSIRDSAIIYSDGRFNFSKLKNQEDYILEVGDVNFDVQQADIYALLKYQRRKLWKLQRSYSYTPIIMEKEEDTEFDFDRFVLETAEPIAEGSQVYLYEDATANYVDTSEIGADGSFQFERMDRGKQYSLKFDEGIDLEDAQLYSVSEGDQKEITKGEDGYAVEPEKLLEPGEERMTLVLGAVKNNGEIKMEPKEEKPYPLTPPVDEKEEPVEVPKTVVNETVFEPVIEEEETKPGSKQAVAVLDDSDWREMVSKGEVYETKRGYNLHFEFNKFLLSENQIEYLQKVVIPMLRKNPEMKLTIEGHTDSIGSDEVNYRMAVLRASNVLYHLEMAGIEDTRLDIIAKGESEPLAPNSLPEGRAINRRVELIKEQNNP